MCVCVCVCIFTPYTYALYESNMHNEICSRAKPGAESALGGHLYFSSPCLPGRLLLLYISVCCCCCCCRRNSLFLLLLLFPTGSDKKNKMKLLPRSKLTDRGAWEYESCWTTHHTSLEGWEKRTNERTNEWPFNLSEINSSSSIIIMISQPASQPFLFSSFSFWLFSSLSSSSSSILLPRCCNKERKKEKRQRWCCSHTHTHTVLYSV